MIKIGGMGFDPNNIPEGIWGDYASGARIKARKINVEILNALKKPYTTTSMQLDTKARKMVPVEKVDDEAYEDALTDYMIEDFEGFGDNAGNALPVNLESKKMLLNIISIKEWVWAFAQSLEVFAAEKKGAETGN